MPTITLFESEGDSTPKALEGSWEDLLKGLADCTYTACQPCKGHDCAHKKGRAWSPVKYAEGAQRGNAGVVEITYGVFDLDNTTDAQLAQVAQALDGTAYLCHQTHSGTGWRLVIPFTRPVPVAAWAEVWPAIVARFNLPTDQACKDPGRIYFVPTRPEGSGFQFYSGVGPPFDVDRLDLVLPRGAETALLAFKTGLQLESAVRSDPSDARNYREGPVDLDQLRQAVRGMRRPESRQLLDTILGGRRIADVGQRDSEILRACGLLACAPIGKPYPADTVVALLEPCIRAMDCAPEGLEHWISVARDKYTRAVAQRLERDVRSEADKAGILKVLGMTAEAPGEDNWRKGLIYALDKDGQPAGLKHLGANANLILEHDPDWARTLRFNEVTKEISVDGGPAAGFNRACLDVEISNWLARSQYKLHLNSFGTSEQVLAVARKHGYDPIRDWLLSLRWDGVPRITNFFRDYLGAQGDMLHIDRVSRCFLISCAARGLDPGCEVHTVPILQGKQGCGKSRSLRALGGEYFTDTKLKIQDKDSRILASQNWIIELAELASIRNQDIDEVKSFVSQRDDKIRPPYGRVHELFLRHCVFVGTTNPDDFLNDWTGNRRWWPINVTACDVDKVTRDRDQLMAEAVVAYQTGEAWHLNDAEAERAEQIAQGFMRKSIRTEQALQWFAAKPPHQRPIELTSYDIAHTIFGVPTDRIDRGVQTEIGYVAKELGMERKRKRMGEKLVWVYAVPRDLLEMPHNAKPVTPVTLIEGAKAQ
jgi:hypothetical protein